MDETLDVEVPLEKQPEDSLKIGLAVSDYVMTVVDEETDEKIGRMRMNIGCSINFSFQGEEYFISGQDLWRAFRKAAEEAHER